MTQCRPAPGQGGEGPGATPRQRSAGTTRAELTDAAIALRPHLLSRAFELTHNDPDAEDLVQDVYVAFVSKPPSPQTPAQLKHWCRVVLLNRRNGILRDCYRDDTELVSLDALNGWAG